MSFTPIVNFPAEPSCDKCTHRFFDLHISDRWAARLSGSHFAEQETKEIEISGHAIDFLRLISFDHQSRD